MFITTKELGDIDICIPPNVLNWSNPDENLHKNCSKINKKKEKEKKG